MQKKLLKTSLFGFSKAQVCEYIAKVNNDFNDRMQAITAEHMKEKNDLFSQIAALTDEVNQYKQTTGDIAQALFDAQQYAAELKAKADGEYKAVSQELLNLQQAETQKLNGYRDKVEKIRTDIVALLVDLDSRLSEQTNKTENLIAEYHSEEGITI